jgi:aldehyde:ferredoxin oxidoreductase
MIKGYCHRILRIDLKSESAIVEQLNPRLIDNYIGGRGFAAKFMYDEILPHTNPFSPDNRIYIFTGPINGTVVPYSSRFVIATKSPLTGTYTRTLSGGQFSAELKFAGYDGIVLEGNAQRPVYLHIQNGKASIKGAAHLWGKSTADTEKCLKSEHKGASCLCIGPAGEKKIRFACVLNDGARAAGRGGVGAIFGAKKLKAIVVNGKGSVAIAVDKHEMLDMLHDSLSAIKSHPKVPGRILAGTTETVQVTNELGILPIRNFSGGRLKNSENLYAKVFREKLVLHDESCFSCPLPCGKTSIIRSGPYKGTDVQGPQYETIGMLGANCGITNIETVAMANSICNLGGVDTIESGNVIGFAMECYGKGFLTSADTGGIELRFGNDSALIASLEALINQTSFGRLLGDGVQALAEKLGPEANKFAMASKRQGFASFEPRALVGMGLLYATSPVGANHSIGPTLSGEMSLGLTTTEGKAELVINNQNNYCFMDSLVICAFSRYGLDNEIRRKFLEAVTGRSFDIENISRRIFTLERLFNFREGYNRIHDTLPHRSLKEPMVVGENKSSTVNLECMLNHYYSLRKWDKQGVPTKRCLETLGLNEEMAALIKAGAVLGEE